MRALCLALMLLVLAPRAAAESALRATPVPLGRGEPQGAASGALRFMGALRLEAEDRRFGGLSGLAVTEGLGVVAVSDRGYFVAFALVEDEAGRLVGAEGLSITPMTDGEGGRLRQPDRDAEDLALLADGTRLVVFERNARLGWFPPGSGRQTRTQTLLDLVTDDNEAIESVVALPDGRLFLIAEDLLEGPIRPAWVGAPGGWQRLEYLPEADQAPVGAALLPDGDLLVLERSASPLSGFKARLRRVAGSTIAPGARLSGETLLVLEPPALGENFEAVATRPLPDGGAAIYLVSDDNYFFLQRTLLLKFVLPVVPAATR
jgi:hypothetical protein